MTVSTSSEQYVISTHSKVQWNYQYFFVLFYSLRVMVNSSGRFCLTPLVVFVCSILEKNYMHGFWLHLHYYAVVKDLILTTRNISYSHLVLAQLDSISNCLHYATHYTQFTTSETLIHYISKTWLLYFSQLRHCSQWWLKLKSLLEAGKVKNFGSPKKVFLVLRKC